MWRDCNADTTWEAARQAPYQPHEGVLSLGYTDCVDWIRLRIAPSPEPLALRITPYWLDQVTLHDPRSPGPPSTLGDRHPSPQGVLAGLAHVFTLPAADEARDVWLRLASTSTHRLAARALPLAQAGQEAALQIAWASLYTAVLLLLLVLLFGVWWGQRDGLLGAYLVRLACFTLYGCSYLGLPHVLAHGTPASAWMDWIFSFSAVLMLPAGIWFDVVFLSLYGAHRRWLVLLRLVGGCGFGLLALFLLGHARLALQANIQVLMAGSLLIGVAAFTCAPARALEQIVPRRLVLGYYLFTSASVLLGLGGVLGWFARPDWMMHALILHGLLSALIMTAILVARGRRMASQHMQLAWQLENARQEVLQEQRQHQEQSRFLHMLMHEIKTPLSVLSLALAAPAAAQESRAHAHRAIRDMKAILDRCLQADQLGQLAAGQAVQSLGLAALLREVAADNPAIARRIALAAADGLPAVRTDAQLLRIIVFNLLDNAARYGEPGTPVQVVARGERRGGRAGALLQVEHPPGSAGWPDASELFTKYYRAPGARRVSGSGLGLFLSRQLAESLGGMLAYVPDERNQKVRFELWIPLQRD